MSTYNVPRVTVIYEENENEIILPRGLYEELIDELMKLGVKYDEVDERIDGENLDVSFVGNLYEEQQKAFEELSSHRVGVLSATTGFGVVPQIRSSCFMQFILS